MRHLSAVFFSVLQIDVNELPVLTAGWESTYVP